MQALQAISHHPDSFGERSISKREWEKGCDGGLLPPSHRESGLRSFYPTPQHQITPEELLCADSVSGRFLWRAGMFKRLCRKEVLVSMPYGTICRCACGIFYVRFGEMTLCFPAFEFEALARLFKLSLGMITAEKLNEVESNPFLNISEKKQGSHESRSDF